MLLASCALHLHITSYGNKFDKAVDDAVAHAKSYGKDAEQDLKKSFEDIKHKAGDVSAEAQKKLAEAKAEVTKSTEQAKVMFTMRLNFCDG